jgi:hypothetical protein
MSTTNPLDAGPKITDKTPHFMIDINYRPALPVNVTGRRHYGESHNRKSITRILSYYFLTPICINIISN